MKLEKKNLIVERPYKSVYKTEEGVVKIFVTDHPKSAVFNEALNTVKVEETGLDIPKLKEVTQINGEWALVIENRGCLTTHFYIRNPAPGYTSFPYPPLLTHLPCMAR